MEIRVTATMSGRRFRERILERWGSREALERKAREGHAEAEEDRFMLDRLAEDPARLDAEHERTAVTFVGSDQLSRLTEKRLALLEAVGSAGEPLNVSELARRVGRDKKNVSEDLALLEELGLVERIEHGREKTVRIRGTRISIDLEETRVPA